MNSKTYTASVVGAGSGGTLSIRALAASGHFDLVAVADVSESARERVRTEHEGVMTFTDHATMFAERPTEVVCVSTWPPSHLEVTLAALSTGGPAGKRTHLLCAPASDVLLGAAC